MNLTISCLQHYFNMVKEKEGKLPPVLFLQLDNAAKDNKNAVSRVGEGVHQVAALSIVTCHVTLSEAEPCSHENPYFPCKFPV